MKIFSALVNYRSYFDASDGQPIKKNPGPGSAKMLIPAALHNQFKLKYCSRTPKLQTVASENDRCGR